MPSLAIHGLEAYVVGNNVAVYDDELIGMGSLAALSTTTGNIGRPPGEFWFLRPQAVLDTTGTLHVVWGEPVSSGEIPRADFVKLRANSLWYSAYESDQGWSDPQQLLTTPHPLGWGPSQSTLVLDARGQIHLAVPEGATAVQYLVREQTGTWRARPSVQAGTAYVSTAATKDDRIYLALVIGRDLRVTNQVTLVRSSDGGRSWSAPTMIDRSGGAVEPTLLMAPDGVLRLVWGYDPDGGLNPQILRMMESTDHGVIWSAPQDLRLPMGAEGLQAAIDPCGSLHVVFLVPVTDHEHRRIGYAQWSGQWSEPQLLFPEHGFLEMDLAIDSSGRLLLSGMARSIDIPLVPDPWFQPVTAELQRISAMGR